MPNRYNTEYKTGQHNLNRYGMDIHHPVFAVSSGLILLFLSITILFPEAGKTIFDDVKSFAINNFDWFFVISANFFVLFCLILIFHPLGRIRLGGVQAKPEFSTWSWLAMLFAAGMGIGLMFWSVAEPVAYYTGWYGTPLGVGQKTASAKELALGATMFHWGLHPWSIYAVVGLSLAFFTFNKNLPLTIRSSFFPVLKEHSWGSVGHVIDVVAVLATIFGLATSLGFGAQQAAGGIDYLFGLGSGITAQIAIIALVTSLATISVVRGLDGGVKFLSNVNMLAALLLLFCLVALGPTLEILKAWFTVLISYAQNFAALSNWVDRSDNDFFHGWTVFYWAWWISWSPFVGMFIARISRGRTIRQFLIAVIVLPTLVTSFWMGAFGGTALEQINSGQGALINGISKVELTLFQMLEQLPFATTLSGLSILLVLCFFVTSSDSGSLVIDSITAGGKLDAPVPQRVFWAVMEGVIAIALLWGGGSDALGALQAAVISMGLPFCGVLVLICGCLLMGLLHEQKFADVKKPSATS